MPSREASRTAVLVCQGRAAAHGRLAAGVFCDPTAARMLDAGERVPVDQVLAGEVPNGWSARVAYESVRACAEVVVPRTVAIDRAVGERPGAQVVILGAGLDGRSWRMDGLGDVYEVDRPASQQDKHDRVARWADPSDGPTFVPVDLAQEGLDEALTAAGHDRGRPTVWVWEGVVPYLTTDEVESTLASVGDLSAGGSRLVVNYQSPSLRARAGRLLARGMSVLSRTPDPFTAEPWRSTWRPEELARLLRGHGFAVVSDHDLLTLAADLPMEVRGRRSLRNGRVLVADRA